MFWGARVDDSVTYLNAIRKRSRFGKKGERVIGACYTLEVCESQMEIFGEFEFRAQEGTGLVTGIWETLVY